MNPIEPTTSELIQHCLAGQRSAWEILITRFERLIFYTAVKTGMSTDEAADVFQAVCLIWFEELGRLNDPERLGAWLVTTTRRECWARFRRDRMLNDDDLEKLVKDKFNEDESPENLAACNEDAFMVRQAMKELPKACQKLLEHFFFDPGRPSYAEIARRLKMPVNSLGPSRTRCLARLKEILQKLGW